MKFDEESKPLLHELKQLEKRILRVQWTMNIAFTLIAIILAILFFK